MSSDPDLEQLLTDIANPADEEIRKKQRIEDAERWSEFWFLLMGLVALLAFGIFWLLAG